MIRCSTRMSRYYLLLLLPFLPESTSSRHGHVVGARANNKEHEARLLSIVAFGAIADEKESASDLWPLDEFIKNEQPHLLRTSKRKKGGGPTHQERVELAINNVYAFNRAIQEAQPGDTVLVPDGQSFTMFGGVAAIEKNDLTIDIAGSCHFVYDLDWWPVQSVPTSPHYWGKVLYDPGLTIFNSTRITLTSSSSTRAQIQVDYKRNHVHMVNCTTHRGGILNGNGKNWWNDVLTGRLKEDTRPRLLFVRESEDILVEHLTLINSPFWSLTIAAVGAELRHINVLVDREYQASILAQTQSTPLPSAVISRRQLQQDANDISKIPLPIDDLPDWMLSKFNQPQDLNTDGIDPIGQDIWIHDCIIQNADDSIAVKPAQNFDPTETRIPPCTSNITIENMVLTGFGASIGSVDPSPLHSCIDNVVFRNISMPGTGKGIYIKSEYGAGCTPGVESGQITNILYENIRILNPWWWAVWIGPQQQHQPNKAIGNKCELTWPVNKHCPSTSCIDFENITLRNILIKEPLISPGVIMGNITNTMRNLLIENLQVTEAKNKPWYGKWPFHSRQYPWRGQFRCYNANGGYNNSFPNFPCLDQLEP